MDNLNRLVLRELTDRTNGLFTSLYMPTHKAGPQTRQDPIRLRNLLRRAEENLVDAGTRRSDVVRVLEPAWRLLDDADFWRHQCDGLALFAGDGFFRRFCLPLSFQELLVVSDRAHVKPLLPLFVDDGLFFVLAISLKHARLLQCTRHTVRETPLEGVPTSLEQAMQGTTVEGRVQPHVQPTERAAIFHAMGDIGDDAAHKTQIQEYLRMLGRGVDRRLAERPNPLVLAGADYIRAFYRQSAGFPHIAEAGIAGSPDHLGDAELKDRGWQIVGPLFHESLTRAVGLYRSASGTPRASHELAEIVPAAHQGLVGTLFVSLTEQRWGAYDPGRDRVELRPDRRPGDCDLLDLAAVYTLQHRGQVFAIPSEGILNNVPVAAVFRGPASGMPSSTGAAAT